jgi:hypothetical protein
MITAFVIYDMPKSISREQCLAHYRKIAPDFLEARGFFPKQFIYGIDGKIAGGAYMWATLDDAKAFYSGPKGSNVALARNLNEMGGSKRWICKLNNT